MLLWITVLTHKQDYMYTELQWLVYWVIEDYSKYNFGNSIIIFIGTSRAMDDLMPSYTSYYIEWIPSGWVCPSLCENKVYETVLQYVIIAISFLIKIIITAMYVSDNSYPLIVSLSCYIHTRVLCL